MMGEGFALETHAGPMGRFVALRNCLENPAHRNFVFPGWDPKGKDSVRDNILRQRDDIRLPPGMTPEGWLRQAESEGRILGGARPLLRRSGP
jgi:hypothetical protein